MKMTHGILAAVLAVGVAATAHAEEKFITIGTGGQTGVYYVVGQSVCRLVNRGTAKHNIKCTAPSTGGRVLRALLAFRMSYTRATQLAALFVFDIGWRFESVSRPARAALHRAGFSFWNCH